ncbi:MAG: helix-turn-helix domain-containing protein [Lactobacillus sp.]|nr:helix-turn-helix domain-containing protein [Lactobacillus sp.]
MAPNFSAILKQTRRQQHLTQKQLAAGICSQPMLSAIEHGRYTPNAQLLIALCQRLNLSLDQISLAQNFNISANQNFDQTLNDLCNQHHYQQLLTFLAQDSVLASIQTDQQTQAYYYYLGVAKLHTQGLTAAKEALQLSLAGPGAQNPTTLTRLGQASLGYIAAAENLPQTATKNFNLAVKALAETNYDTNQNVLFYLIALGYFKLNQLPASLDWVNQGIEFTSDHDSHYLLANYYYLLARVAQASAQSDLQLEASQRQTFIQDLFHEKIFKDF